MEERPLRSSSFTIKGRTRMSNPRETDPFSGYPETVLNPTTPVHAALPPSREVRRPARLETDAETSPHPDRRDHHRVRPVDENATDLAELFFGPSPTSLPAAPSPARSWSPPSPGRRTTVTVAAALTLTLAAGAGLTWALQRDDTATIALQPVHGWTQRAAWASDPLARDSAPRADVLPVGGMVATTLEEDGATKVAALDPTTGQTVWAEDLDEDLTGPLQAVGPGRGSLAATTAHSLTIWERPRNGEPTTWRFSEADVKPVAGSPVPLLTNPTTATALTVHDGQLVRRTLPSGTRAVAALPTGAVIAVSKDGHWWSVTEERGEATLLQPPTYGARVKSVAGVVGTTLLVTWTNGRTGTSVAGYAVDDDMAPTWHHENVPGDATRMTPSPDGTWAILGTVALDTATGKPTYLPAGWKTLRLTNEAAWSREHVAPKLGAARVLDSPVKDLATVPVATTRAGRGLIVHAPDDDARIVALEPNTDHAYDDGDQVITKPPATPKIKETTKAKTKAKTKTKTKATRSTSNKETTRRDAAATKGKTK